MQNSKVLVIGASGVVGSELVRSLQARGTSVRAATSKSVSASQDGVEHVTVDLTTGEGLDAAMAGVDRAFLMSPSGFADQYRILSPLIQQAKLHGLKKVVLMTAFGANADADAPMRRAEIELEQSGLDYHIIRPSWFMQNFHTYWLQGIREHGKILLPAGTAKVSFIDTRDIAAVAATLLTQSGFTQRAFDLTGSRALDHDEVARELTRATGRAISYEQIAPEALREGMIGGGVPADYADLILFLFVILRDGHNAAVTDDVKKILGRAARDFEAYAQDHRAAWL